MAQQQNLSELAAYFETLPALRGKRLDEVPGEPRALRYKWRWRFYRMADAAFVLLIWNALAAAAGSNPAWYFALAFGAMNVWTILFCESRARICTRQLNRRAAEQLARDICGVWY